MRPLPEHLPEYLVNRIDSAMRDAREALLSCALAA
jgi:hypothetical protein